MVRPNRSLERRVQPVLELEWPQQDPVARATTLRTVMTAVRFATTQVTGRAPEPLVSAVANAWILHELFDTPFRRTGGLSKICDEARLTSGWAHRAAEVAQEIRLTGSGVLAANPAEVLENLKSSLAELIVALERPDLQLTIDHLQM